MSETDYAQATWSASPNFWAGRSGHAIKAVVLHGTAGGGAVAWFAQQQSGVSAHYVVLETGGVVQCVREADSAWHAGVVTPNSAYAGGVNPNYWTIGVEHERNTENDNPMPAVQLDASVALVRDILRRHGTLQILRHDQIDVGRICPGPGFPLDRFTGLSAGASAGAPTAPSGVYPYTDCFVSQLHPNGSGEADCFQACLGAYAKADGKIPMATDQLALLDHMSMLTRGTHDQPNNPYTNLTQATAGLHALALPAQWSTSYQAALASPWSISLVDGAAIRKAGGARYYPDSWMGGESGPDHFILWGPAWEGAPNWVMNPLDPDRRWSQIDIGSLRAAFGGAYLLPAVAAQPDPLKHWRARQSFGLLAKPQHGSTAFCVVPRGGTGIDYGNRARDASGTTWARLGCQPAGHWYAGWAPADVMLET